MPTYEYICNDCHKRFSKMMTFGEHERGPKPQCPKCKSKKVSQRVSSFQAVTSKKT